MLGPPRAMNASMQAAERANSTLLGHNLLQAAPEDGSICSCVQLVHGAHGDLHGSRHLDDLVLAFREGAAPVPAAAK